jgi:hypothetical protein
MLARSAYDSLLRQAEYRGHSPGTGPFLGSGPVPFALDRGLVQFSAPLCTLWEFRRPRTRARPLPRPSCGKTRSCEGAWVLGFRVWVLGFRPWVLAIVVRVTGPMSSWSAVCRISNLTLRTPIWNVQFARSWSCRTVGQSLDGRDGCSTTSRSVRPYLYICCDRGRWRKSICTFGWRAR